MLNLTNIKRIFSRRERRRNHIKSELAAKGYSLADIARDLGCHRAMVTMVIAGKAVSEPIQTKIEEIIGKKYFGNGKK